jgi:hypothetical protein
MAKPVRISEREKKEWTINFLRKYISIELQNKYMNTRRCINYGYIGTYGRRISTIISFLKEKKLIKINSDIEPNYEEIKKIISLPEYNSQPSFLDNVYIHSYSSLSKEIISNKIKMFKDILLFKCSEMIYIYNNQDQFIFKISGRKLLVILKETYNKIDDIVLRAYAKKEIDEDFNTILSYSLDLKFIALNKSTDNLTNTLELDKLTEEQLSERIIKQQEKIKFLKRKAKETKILHRYITRFGEEGFRARLIVHSLDYIKSSAPLWINSSDKRKIKIAKIVLEGLPEE